MSQSLDRALAILGELADGPRTLDQLAETVDVHKSTVLRLLRTLESRRFVQRSDPRHYRLGVTLFDLASRALEDRDVRRLVEPELRALNESTRHTVHLASYEAGEVVYIDKFDGQHSARKILKPPLVVPRLGGEAVGVLSFAFRQRTDGARSHRHQLQARRKLDNNRQGRSFLKRFPNR